MTTKFDHTSFILLKIWKFLLLNFTFSGNCKISYGIWFTIYYFTVLKLIVLIFLLWRNQAMWVNNI